MFKRFGAFATVIFLLLSAACTHVDPGNVGVRVDSYNGKIDSEAVGVGYHWTGLFTEIYEYPISLQTLEISDINAPTADQMTVKVDASLTYSVRASAASAVYQKHRKTMEEIGHGFISQAVRTAVSDATSTVNPSDLVSAKREQTFKRIVQLLRDRLGPEGFEVSQFAVKSIDVPKQLTDAISAKIAADQIAQRVESERRQTLAEGDKIVAAAQKAAEAMRIKSEAEAAANRRIADSLTPTLLEAKRIERWDGRVAQVNGGALLLPQLSK